MFNRGQTLEAKRNDIIMACLRGGQHIDAALEAADKLVPQREIEEAFAIDKERADRYEKRMQEITDARKNDYKMASINTKSKPWYVSAVLRWWPF